VCSSDLGVKGIFGGVDGRGLSKRDEMRTGVEYSL
jgi:hypothetical protein